MHNVRREAAIPESGPGESDAGRGGLVRRWSGFFAGLAAILAFAFGVVPAFQKLGPVRTITEGVRESGIDASALFYTETEVASEAEASLRNALKY